MNKISRLTLAAAGLSLSSLVSAQLLNGVTTSNELVTFNAFDPGTFLTSVPITGLKSFDGVTDDPFASIVDIAADPFTYTLYGVDTNANFYEIKPNGNTSYLGFIDPFGFDAGLAYDPFYDNYLWVSDAGDNIAIETDGTSVAGPSTVYDLFDINASEFPFFMGLGIDPFFGEAFAIDSELDILAQSFTPDTGEWFTIGDLGVDITGLGDLAIGGQGDLLAALSEDAFSSSLYSIDPFSGAASKIGDFSSGLSGITFGPGHAIPEPTTAFPIVFGGAIVLFICRRRRD